MTHGIQWNNVRRHTTGVLPSTPTARPDAPSTTHASVEISRGELPGVEQVRSELLGPRKNVDENGVEIRPLAERNRVRFTLTNDNYLSLLSVEPGTGFGAGDDFGLSHGWKVDIRTSREKARYLLGASSYINTLDLGGRAVRDDGKPIITQHALEISKIYFAVELEQSASQFVRVGGGIGLRNGDHEIPGLAMSEQQALHNALPRAPVFDNRPCEGMTLFAEAEGAIGLAMKVPGSSDRLQIRGEAGASLNTFLAGSRLFGIVEADFTVVGPLKLHAEQLTEILLKQKFSFNTTAGIHFEMPSWMIGLDAKIPFGHLDDKYTRFNDTDPVINIVVEVGI